MTGLPTLDDYAEVVGRGRIDVVRRLAARLEGVRLVVINSTRVGGGDSFARSSRCTPGHVAPRRSRGSACSTVATAAQSPG